MKQPQMKELLTEWRKLLVEEEEERVVFKPKAVDLPIPKKLVKLLDPDITPQKFAALDAELDAGDNKKHQAFAIAGFAMTYANNDASVAEEIIKLSILSLKQIKAATAGESEETEETEETEPEENIEK